VRCTRGVAGACWCAPQRGHDDGGLVNVEHALRNGVRRRGCESGAHTRALVVSVAGVGGDGSSSRRAARALMLRPRRATCARCNRQRATVCSRGIAALRAQRLLPRCPCPVGAARTRLLLFAQEGEALARALRVLHPRVEVGHAKCLLCGQPGRGLRTAARECMSACAEASTDECYAAQRHARACASAQAATRTLCRRCACSAGWRAAQHGACAAAARGGASARSGSAGVGATARCAAACVARRAAPPACVHPHGRVSSSIASARRAAVVLRGCFACHRPRAQRAHRTSAISPAPCYARRCPCGPPRACAFASAAAAAAALTAARVSSARRRGASPVHAADNKHTPPRDGHGRRVRRRRARRRGRPGASRRLASRHLAPCRSQRC
jgi:hypothetical protein